MLIPVTCALSSEGQTTNLCRILPDAGRKIKNKKPQNQHGPSAYDQMLSFLVLGSERSLGHVLLEVGLDSEQIWVSCFLSWKWLVKVLSDLLYSVCYINICVWILYVEMLSLWNCHWMYVISSL